MKYIVVVAVFLFGCTNTNSFDKVDGKWQRLNGGIYITEDKEHGVVCYASGGLSCVKVTDAPAFYVTPKHE